MSDEIKTVIKAAIAGEGPTKEEAKLAGRMLFTYGWRISAFAFAYWALGGFERWGLGAGFAFAQETKHAQVSLEGRLTAIERRQLEADIMSTLKERCAAPSKDYFRERLNALQRDYSEMNKGGPLPLPTCEELGITKQ